MYILLEGTKGRYDRPIAMNIIATASTVEALQDDMKIRLDWFEVDETDIEEDDLGNIIYITEGCPADNEYIGTTLEIKWVDDE